MISVFKTVGNEKINWYKKAASETFAFNDMVGINTSGYVTKYLDGSAFPCVGLIQKAILATDSDYASNTLVPIFEADDNTVFLCDVSTGSAAQTDVGEYIDVDDQDSVDVGASTNNDFYVVGIVSTTQVLAKMTRLSNRAIES